MDVQTGHSIADFINEHSTRFRAGVLVFGGACWVVVGDGGSNDTPQIAEPIENLGNYLARAGQGSVKLDGECRALLEAWQASNSATAG